MHADEAASWDDLHERFEVKRIDHQEAYSLDGASTNMVRNTSDACAVARSESPSYFRPVPPPVCTRGLLARGQSPRPERRAGEPHSGTGNEAREVC